MTGTLTLTKALANYGVARLTRKYNRKTILAAGWVAHRRMCCTLKKLYPSEECSQPAYY